MPIYEIEQYQTHVETFQVEAANEAEAIAKIYDGDGTPIDGNFYYLETNEDVGLNADEYTELAKELSKKGYGISDIIPSIRSIKKVTNESAG